MKIEITEKEWKYLQEDVSHFTDLVPALGVQTTKGIEIEMDTDDWDDLTGYIAAEANHAKSKTKQRVLDDLHSKIESMLQDFDA